MIFWHDVIRYGGYTPQKCIRKVADQQLLTQLTEERIKTAMPVFFIFFIFQKKIFYFVLFCSSSIETKLDVQIGLDRFETLGAIACLSRMPTLLG